MWHHFGTWLAAMLRNETNPSSTVQMLSRKRKMDVCSATLNILTVCQIHLPADTTTAINVFCALVVLHFGASDAVHTHRLGCRTILSKQTLDLSEVGQ